MDTSPDKLPLTATLPFQARIKKSAWFNAMRRHGCESFSVYNRTYTAMGFYDPVTEYNDLLNGVVLWPVSGERQVEITGPDAARFVQYLTPRDLSRCEIGQCKYVLITADDGGIVNDPICLRLDNNHFWLSAADSDLWLYARGVNAVAGMDVTIRDPDVAVLQVQGPKSAQLMQDLLGDEVKDLRYFYFGEFRIADAPVIVSRTGWSSEWGYEVFLRDASMGDVVFDHIVEVGRSHDIRLGTVSQIRRIEGGMLSYGLDMGLSENPYELELGRLVEFDNDNAFIGRESLQALSLSPPDRVMRGVSFDGEPVTGFIEPWLLDIHGATATRVTSLCYSPRLEKNIGLALIPAPHSDPGTEVFLHTPDGGRTGEVSLLPFVPRRQNI